MDFQATLRGSVARERSSAPALAEGAGGRLLGQVVQQVVAEGLLLLGRPRVEAYPTALEPEFAAGDLLRQDGEHLVVVRKVRPQVAFYGAVQIQAHHVDVLERGHHLEARARAELEHEVHSLYREAMYIVDQGIADIEAVDLMLKFGPGARFQVMPTFEHIDMVGLDLDCAVEGYLWPHLADTHEVFPMLSEKVARGELGFKTGGVGFRTWTPEEQVALREKLLDYLARQVAAGAFRPS